MQMNHKQRTLVEANMGLVGAVIRDNVHDVNNIGVFTYDDIFQIGCIGLCKAAVSDKGNAAKFSTYAYICIRNEIFGALEYSSVRRRREMSVEDDYLLPLGGDGAWDDYFSTAGAVELFSTLGDLQSRTSGVMAKGIEAMKLYALGYNYREIGELMGGVSAKNVTAWVSRARKYLRDQPELLHLKEEAV